ncbi:hypothetical protein DPMN_130528 [Dreissena polymorpha]|uniref:Uncharacterized protein n=1 Tax=Dreissena polymorpha TaxID=45954 RepID=A0A9D4K1D2_DREPO|nr:hypothetical protein DPMN_130528 [Dreissena polymorpha]
MIKRLMLTNHTSNKRKTVLPENHPRSCPSTPHDGPPGTSQEVYSWNQMIELKTWEPSLPLHARPSPTIRPGRK